MQVVSYNRDSCTRSQSSCDALEQQEVSYQVVTIFFDEPWLMASLVEDLEGISIQRLNQLLAISRRWAG
jgi:hypothetical protein